MIYLFTYLLDVFWHFSVISVLYGRYLVVWKFKIKKIPDDLIRYNVYMCVSVDMFKNIRVEKVQGNNP